MAQVGVAVLELARALGEGVDDKLTRADLARAPAATVAAAVIAAAAAPSTGGADGEWESF